MVLVIGGVPEVGTSLAHSGVPIRTNLSVNDDGGVVIVQFVLVLLEVLVVFIYDVDDFITFWHTRPLEGRFLVQHFPGSIHLTAGAWDDPVSCRTGEDKDVLVEGKRGEDWTAGIYAYIQVK